VTERVEKMPDLTDILTSMIPVAAGALGGWLLNSLRKASKADLTAAVATIERRLDEIEIEQRGFITRSEFRDALKELKDDLGRQHEAVHGQLQELNRVLLNRRPTNP
jgi:hypothetical protein